MGKLGVVSPGGCSSAGGWTGGRSGAGAGAVGRLVWGDSRLRARLGRVRVSRWGGVVFGPLGMPSMVSVATMTFCCAGCEPCPSRCRGRPSRGLRPCRESVTFCWLWTNWCYGVSVGTLCGGPLLYLFFKFSRLALIPSRPRFAELLGGPGPAVCLSAGSVAPRLGPNVSVDLSKRYL